MHIHFIGIGGIGVSGIAQLALKKGDKVSGSDIRESALTRKLELLGVVVFKEHKKENVHGVDLVVYSSAISADNPEMVEARARGIRIKRRAEFLSDLMGDKKVIAITGAHGKTTTSFLAAKLLQEAGLNPSVAVGGILREDGDNVKSGASDYFVAEADESDGTFLCYAPTYSIITNIDHEHMDFYGTFENLLSSFLTFVRRTKKGGCVFYCFDDEALKVIVKKGAVRSVSFGYSCDADFYPKNITFTPCHLNFECFRKGKKIGEVSLGLMGRHNVLNALSVVALGLELGLDFSVIKKGLAAFKGVERRFQVKYEDADIFIVDDYAHHPTEIAATLEAARVCERKRLVVVFQPHRYTRTKLLLDKFAGSFLKSDYLLVTDIYPAGESPLPGISAQSIVDKVRQEARLSADYVAKDKIIEHLKSVVRRDDLVLFLGAGDITKISDEFAKSFQK
jgi:UDP-N-acetylmuramate--alanine ligase